MQQVDIYYQDNGKKIRKMVDKILVSFGGISQKDKDDFYSVANETFVHVLRVYNPEQNFDSFLYSCLQRKIKTEMTRRNRIKRKGDAMSISLDNIDNETNASLLVQIASDFDVWEEVNRNKCQSEKMERYLDSLSKTQRKILFMLAEDFKNDEIESALKISHQQYLDNLECIKSYENICILL